MRKGLAIVLTLTFWSLLTIPATGGIDNTAQAEQDEQTDCDGRPGPCVEYATGCVERLQNQEACDTPPPPPPPAGCNLQFWGWAFTKQVVGALGTVNLWEVYGNANGAGGCDGPVSFITVEMTVEPEVGEPGQRGELCGGDATLLTRDVSSCHVDTADNFWFNQPRKNAIEGQQVCFAGEITGQFYTGTGGVPAISRACHTT